MHIKEAEYGSILYQCSKGPDKSKKQGDVQSDKKAADLFWHGGTDWSTVIFKRPKIRPYKTDNYYAALLRQAEAEKEVEKIVRLSQKEKSGEQEVHNAGRIKQSRPDGSKGNRKKCPEK